MKNPVFAWFFDRFGARNEERGQAGLRRELLAGLSGRVVEIGPGNGLNFPHYPATVKELVAVEPERYLRDRAQEAAHSASVPVRVVDGLADRIPANDASFDAVVISGLLCSVPDQQRALREFMRVVRPGGELRFYEHVRSRSDFAGVQRVADIVWPRLMGGCQTGRDTFAAIKNSDWHIESCRGLVFPPTAKISPVSPRILGTARR